MDIKKESITLNETVMHTKEKILVSGDIIIPDIKSDMAKILKMDADVVVDNCTYSAGRIEPCGKLVLTVLYVPENDTKPVCSVTTEMPFESQIENKNLPDGVRCVSNADIFNIEFNMLNARKFSIRAVIDLDIMAIKTTEEEFIVSLDNPSLEVKDDLTSVYRLNCFSNTKFKVDEICDFPQGKPSGISLLKTDVNLLNYQTHAITDKIVIKGTIECCTLYVADTNKIEHITHEIPFSDVIDADGVNENSVCDLQVDVCATSSALKADTDGDMRLVDLSVLFCVKILAYEQAEFSLVSDCFSCTENISCDQKSVSLERLIHKEKLTQSIRGVMSIGENMPPILEVYNFKVKPYVENVKLSEGEVTIDGVCDCYALYLSEKESNLVCSAVSYVPFTFSLKNSDILEAHAISAKAYLENCSYNFAQNGDIDIRIVLNVDLLVSEKYEKNFISDIFVNDEKAESRHGICIYFAKKGDSLWSIAKKYKISLNSLISLNNLDNPDLIYPGQAILIPLPCKFKQ